MESNFEIIIYQTDDSKAKVALMTKDGDIWMNQNQQAEHFETSMQNTGQHMKSVLEYRKLEEDSVTKNYFTTATEGKNYNVAYFNKNEIVDNEIKRKTGNSDFSIKPTYFYNLDVIISVGYRIKTIVQNLHTSCENSIGKFFPIYIVKNQIL